MLRNTKQLRADVDAAPTNELKQIVLLDSGLSLLISGARKTLPKIDDAVERVKFDNFISAIEQMQIHTLYRGE